MAAPKPFSGKIVIVTGSSSGIGRQAALMFAQEGADGLLIHGQSAERLQETQKMLVEQTGIDPSRIVQLIGSMEAEDTPNQIHSAAMERFNGRIDVLVNNAGAGKKPDCADTNSLENLDYLYRVNLRSAVELTQLCMPELIASKGCVVNVSSIAALKTFSFSNGASYGIIKAGMDHFTRNYAAMYGSKGVRVNSVNPGPTETPIFTRHGASPEALRVLDERVKEQTMLERWGQVEEIAECIKFLASSASSYVTGVCLVADGGSVLYSGPKWGAASASKEH